MDSIFIHISLSLSLYIYIYLVSLCLYTYVYIPQTDLSVGVLTALYKGPCLRSGNVRRAARHLCV